MCLKTVLFVYITFLCCCYQVRCKLLLSYGSYFGDSKYTQTDGGVYKATFKKPTKVWNKSNEHLWVTPNGGIFDDGILKHSSYEILTSSWKELPINAILPFHMDLNFQINDKTSILYIRNVIIPSDSERVNQIINKQDNDFILDSDQILVATWRNAKDKTNKNDIQYQNWGNTFQAVIASNGTKTYTIFSYEKLEHNPSNFSIAADNLKIGIKLSESNYCALPANKITKKYNAQQLICQSNVHKPGMILFDITDSSISKCNESRQGMIQIQPEFDNKVIGDFNNITARSGLKSDEVLITFYLKNTTGIRHVKFYVVKRGLNPADTENFYIHGNSFEDLDICHHPYYTTKIYLTKPGFYAIRISLGLKFSPIDHYKYLPWSSFAYISVGMATEQPNTAIKPVEAPQFLNVSLTPVPDRIIISWKYNGSQEDIYSFEIKYENKNATYIVGPRLEYQKNTKTYPLYSVGITIYEYGNFVFNVRAFNKQQKPGPWSTIKKIIDRKSLEAINTTYSDFVPQNVAVKSVERFKRYSNHFILTWRFSDPYHRVVFFEIIFKPPYKSRPIIVYRSKLLSDTLHTYTLKYPYSLRLPGSEFYRLPYTVKIRAAYKTYNIPLSKAFEYGPWSKTTEYYYVPPTKATTYQTTTNKATTEQQLSTSPTTSVMTTPTTKIEKQSTSSLTSTEKITAGVIYTITDHETTPDSSNFTIPLAVTTISTTTTMITTTGISKQTTTTTTATKQSTTAKSKTGTTARMRQDSSTTKFSFTSVNQPSETTLATIHDISTTPNNMSTTVTIATAQDNTTPKITKIPKKQEEIRNSSIPLLKQTSLMIALLCIAFIKTI